MQYIPLSKTALEILSGMEKTSDDKVFYALTPNNNMIEKHIQRWAKEAGLSKHITFHVSRHTFATMSLTAGADLYTVSKLMGHADISATQIYAKVIDVKKREAIDKLPEL